MTSQSKAKELEAMAVKLRRHVIEMTCAAASGHPGGSLSAADIITVLYFFQLRYDAKNPAWPERDRFVMSKGHAAPILYAALAEAGFFPVSQLKTLRQTGSSLQGHVDMLSLPGIEMSTGSLGQGLSAANGMALAARLDKRNYRVYCLMGDGECHEGQIWEAAMTSAHHKLDNLVAFVDHNKYQIDGQIDEIKSLRPFADKWKAFGWKVLRCDGHDISSIISALDKACKGTGRPTVIIADTVKGKGVSFMEERPLDYHGKAPTPEEEKKALAELCQLARPKER